MGRPTILPEDWSLADLLEHLGDVSPQRVRLYPPLGRATEKDVTRIHDRTDRLYELVDGVLVEKVMGAAESNLACEFIYALGAFLRQHPLGFLLAPDGAVRLMPRLVRIPDVSFVGWGRVPEREVPADPVPDLVPDLAIEILSEGNTEKEMERKLKEYLRAGVRLVWYVDPRTRTVDVYTAPDQCTHLKEPVTLTGGDVLPGLALPLREVFARMPRPAEKPARRRDTRRQTKGKRRNGRK